MKGFRLAAVLSAAALALGGCGMLSNGVYDTPLPGGADLGSHPITVSADFDDVLDLVPQSSVKVDNISVGRVSKIRLNADGRSASVELKFNGDVDLPAGTTARLKQTSLLGEKYVALIKPTTPQAGPAVRTGTHLGLAATSEAAQVEQVLGALSLILNGGDVAKFQDISRELQKISADRPEQIKDFLDQMNKFVTVLDDRKGSITTALDGLNQLSKTLNGERGKIVTALDGLSPGMKVLVDQRKQFVSMLSALDRLSTVTVDTLNASQEDIVADFKLLEPILAQLAKSGSDLPNSLQILLTYPFPDSVLGAIKGDYLNVFLTTNFRTVPSGCTSTTGDSNDCLWPQVAGISAQAKGYAMSKSTPASPLLLPPTSSPLPGLPEPTISVPTREPTSTPTPTPTPTPTATPTATSTPTDGGN